MAGEEQSIRELADFLSSLAIPKACELNKPIYKKLFLDNGLLDGRDKLCLKEDVEKIRWLHTLKPSTINIAPYHDNEREYPEVAVLQVALANFDRCKRVAHFINRSIPYPLLLLLTCEVEGELHLAVSVADKRCNQADKDKWVIVESSQSAWLNLARLDEIECQFLRSLALQNLDFKNFFVFYQGLMDRVVALNCALHSGRFSLEGRAVSDKLRLLKELERLEAKKLGLVHKLKKERQMGRQVDLNTAVKQVKEAIAGIKSSL